MSKIADALRKSQATKLIRHEKAPQQPVRPEVSEDVAETVPFPQPEDAPAVEVGRDLVPTDELLEHSESELASRRIIHEGMIDKEAENAFRDLRTLITQKTGGGNSVILVTSVCRGGGSSFVSLNLAAAYAMDWAKTAVVVDCNFRNPADYSVMCDENENGVSDYLADPNINVNEIVNKCGIPRLRIVSCGSRRHDVADLVNSKRADRLVKDLKRRYRERMIFVDAAPIKQSADSQVLMEYCDYVLLVVPYGRSSEQEIAASAKLIPKRKLMGIVFNNEPRFRNPR